MGTFLTTLLSASLLITLLQAGCHTQTQMHGTVEPPPELPVVRIIIWDDGDIPGMASAIAVDHALVLTARHTIPPEYLSIESDQHGTRYNTRQRVFPIMLDDVKSYAEIQQIGRGEATDDDWVLLHCLDSYPEAPTSLQFADAAVGQRVFVAGYPALEHGGPSGFWAKITTINADRSFLIVPDNYIDKHADISHTYRGMSGGGVFRIPAHSEPPMLVGMVSKHNARLFLGSVLNWNIVVIPIPSIIIAQSPPPAPRAAPSP